MNPRTLLTAALSLLLWGGGVATAAKISRPIYKAPPPITYYDWGGFYAGLNIGYGWARSDWDNPNIRVPSNGVLGGGTIGYNIQAGSVVVGIEADLDATGINGSTGCAANTCSVRNGFLGSFRGRLGWAHDRLLPYVTTGWAYGDIRASTNNPAFPGTSQTRGGWVWGGGLEYAFRGNWSTKIEYLHVDLSRFDCSVFCGAPYDYVGFRADMIRLGLNYKFSAPLFTRW